MTGKIEYDCIDDLGFTEQEKELVRHLRVLMSEARERGVFNCSSDFRNYYTTLYLETPSDPPLDCFKGENGWSQLEAIFSFAWNKEGFEKAIAFLEKKMDGLNKIEGV